MQIKNQKEVHLEEIDKQFPLAKQRAEKEKKIQLLNELEAIEKKYGNKEVRATLVQWGRVNTENFDPEIRKVLRKNCQVECAFLIETNWKSDRAGRHYELDVEATEQLIKDRAKWMAEKDEREALENEVGIEVANTIKAIGSVAKAKVSVAKAKPAKKDKAAEEKEAAITQAQADLETAKELKDDDMIAQAQATIDSLTK